MSGIYIPGMEMPESCSACHLKMNCDDCEGRKCVCVPLHQQIGYLDELLTDKRRDDCPLVSVPDGDLIERKSVCLTDFEIAVCDGNFREGMKMLLAKLENAPTIIEAEEVYDKYTDTAGNLHWTGTHSGKHIIPGRGGGRGMSKEKQIWEQPGYDFDPPYPASTPVITNYDRLISKTPEELAEWLAKQEYKKPTFDGWLPLCNKVMGPRICHEDGCEKCWLEWLKSPVEADNGD